MVKRDYVEAQLKKLGVKIKNWGAAEAYELSNILMPHEEITGYVHGWYENGFATLVTTTERLLLVDKKPFHLTIEDVRYDMISEVDFNGRLMDATVRVNTLNKCLRFTSMRQRRLRDLTSYVQLRVMELRQPHLLWQQFEQTPVRHPSLDAVQRAFRPHTQPAATPTLPLPAPQLSPMRRFTPVNHYSKQSLVIKHNFLPKLPRRSRPTP